MSYSILKLAVDDEKDRHKNGIFWAEKRDKNGCSKFAKRRINRFDRRKARAAVSQYEAASHTACHINITVPTTTWVTGDAIYIG